MTTDQTQLPAETPFDDPIRIGVSTCLLGENVRYDGGHQLDKYIVHTLGKYLDFVPVCPEVECGLPIPREAMRLVGDPASPRLVTQKTGVDHTERMQKWSAGRLDDLEKEDLCGFIFKSKSPSSGMERVKVYPEGGGVPVNQGVGVWAGAFKERFPLIPTEEDGRLHDPGLRENFVERIFVMQRWRKVVAGGPRPRDVVDFHTRHKLLLMAHSQDHYRQLGKLVAAVRDHDPAAFAAAYQEGLMTGLAHTATRRRNANVLMHIQGYFKKDLDGDEKQELLDIITSYKDGLLPLIVPITLVNHYVRKYNQEYLASQWYLHPHPKELKLRNHV